MNKTNKSLIDKAIKRQEMSPKELKKLSEIMAYKDESDRDVLKVLLSILGYEPNQFTTTNELDFAQNIINKYKWPYLKNKNYDPKIK